MPLESTTTTQEGQIDTWYANTKRLAEAYDAEAVVIPLEIQEALYDDEFFEIIDVD
jgi:hypothetical protein